MVTASRPTDQGVERAADVLKALSHPQRLAIVRALASGELTVSTLDAELGIRQPNLSQCLSVLREAGLITPRRESKTVVYRLSDAVGGRVVAILNAVFAEEPGAAPSRKPSGDRADAAKTDRPSEAAMFARIG